MLAHQKPFPPDQIFWRAVRSATSQLSSKLATRSAEARKSRKLPSVPNVRKWMQARVAAPLLNAVLDSEERRERKTRVIYLTQVFGIPVRMKRGRFEAPPLWELGEEL